MNKAKPYAISKKAVYESWLLVKENKGSAGVDNESIEKFEKNLKDNLYKIWNRMSSGSYFPSPVKLVEIPKKDGGKRPLGIPTIADRVAQMTCKIYMEPTLEKIFHKDSYGYRPCKSAIQAVGQARKRCFLNEWVIDLDIKGFFDSIDHELMMKAVKHHTDKEWIILYIERWLKATVQHPDGSLKERSKGTPQGGVISPLLANLYLHYALDKWLERNYPSIEFERYADDCIIHCKTERQAEYIKMEIKERLKECKLELHPEKTKVVYCRYNKQKKGKEYPQCKFDFLGFTFKPRRCKSKNGEIFTGFVPAISDKASKNIRSIIRKWRIRRKTGHSIEEIAGVVNSKFRGWINYYGQFYKSALNNIFRMFNRILIRWVLRRYKKFKNSWKRAVYWLSNIETKRRNLFVHWEILGIVAKR